MSPVDDTFDLLLFHRDLDVSAAYLEAGAAGVIVDLEIWEKRQRQSGYDTEINNHGIADLIALRGRTDQKVLCRVSRSDPDDHELSAVIGEGADEIIVPMLTSAAQAERFLRRVDGACKVTLMVETRGAVADIRDIATLPADRIYVGLNDLRIDRGSRTIFAPLADGLLEDMRDCCSDIAFGFGGLTLPGLGAPLPGHHLYAAMARLDCRFTFLRRSFYRDSVTLDPAEALRAIQADLQRYRRRSEVEQQNDAADAVNAVLKLEGLERVV
tara:strand:+ start:180392 stop:181201 length:810 start_codon:yes stop_codon:yes gene_type:complete